MKTKKNYLLNLAYKARGRKTHIFLNINSKTHKKQQQHMTKQKQIQQNQEKQTE